MNVQALIRTGGPAGRLIPHLLQLLAEAGFARDVPASRHQLRLSIAPYAQGEVLQLEESEPFVTCAHRFYDLATGLGQSAPAFTVYDPLGGRLLRYEGGQSCILVDRDGTGTFRGAPLYQLEDDDAQAEALAAAIGAELGQPALAALKHHSGDEVVKASLATDLGAAGAAARDAIVLHRRQLGCEGEPLEALFRSAREELRRADTASLGIVGTLERYGSRVRLTTSPDLEEAIETGADLAADAPTSEALRSLLLPSLAALRKDANQDLFLGRSVAMELLTFPGYQGRNPLTGQVIEVPDKQLPRFYWLESAGG